MTKETSPRYDAERVAALLAYANAARSSVRSASNYLTNANYLEAYDQADQLCGHLVSLIEITGQELPSEIRENG